MSYTMNSKIVSARQGSASAEKEMKARLKTELFQCLDTQLGHQRAMPESDGRNNLEEVGNQEFAKGLTRMPVSALVNRLGRQFLDRNSSWADKIYFYRTLAELMRHALRDFIGFSKLDDSSSVFAKKPQYGGKDDSEYFDFKAWDKSIQSLVKKDRQMALILELYYLGGMSYEGIASALSLTIADVDRKLRFARAWVCRDLLNIQS